MSFNNLLTSHGSFADLINRPSFTNANMNRFMTNRQTASKYIEMSRKRIMHYMDLNKQLAKTNATGEQTLVILSHSC
jgi:hypothetical protein